MSDLTISARFTFTGALGAGEPATGLTLADIEFFLVSQDRDTMAETVIWNSDVVAINPTSELSKVGAYVRKYTGADLDLYNYFASARYTGLISLDQDWINGSIGLENLPLGTSVEFPYIVYYDGTANPIEGVKVEIYRDVAGTDIYWVGWTNALGEARDTYGNYPRLDPGTWYIWRKRGGISFNNPDTEVVT